MVLRPALTAFLLRTAAVGAIGGTALGVGASERLPGARPDWRAVGLAAGLCAAALYAGAALTVPTRPSPWSGRRLPAG